MMPCEDVRKLIEAHLAETLDEPTRRAVTNHLKTCADCHRAVEEARLAGMVLSNAAKLPAPPDLALRIKAAVRARQFYRPRPLHERALGSPAFMATCASLLCGAIICLCAILRVGSVPLDTAPAQLVAAPIEVHSLVTVEAPSPDYGQLQAEPVSSEAPHSLVVREVPSASPPLAASDLPATVSAAKPALSDVNPREARSERPLNVRSATRNEADDVLTVSSPLPASQRTSLPGAVERLPTTTADASRPTVEVPATQPRFTATDLVGERQTHDSEMVTDR